MVCIQLNGSALQVYTMDISLIYEISSFRCCEAKIRNKEKTPIGPKKGKKAIQRKF